MKKGILDRLAYKEKVLFFANAKRATVGQIGQIIDGDIVNFHVGKLRGMIVTRSDGQFKFDNKAEALACAKDFRTMSLKKASEMGLISKTDK